MPTIPNNVAGYAVAQDANKVLSGPATGSAALPTFRTLVTADIPSLSGVYQPVDATLTAFAALTIAANTLTIGTGTDAFSQTTFAANKFPARASTGSLEAKTITDAGLALVAAADAAAMRTLLGIDSDDAVTFGDLTVNNLTVNGTTTTVNSTTLTVDDPLIAVGDGNAADSVDLGLYATYTSSGVKYSGIFRDATDGKWKLFTTLQEAPTTTVNTSGTGYAVGTLIANIESSSATITGGTITGITDIVVADGGTGLSSATAYAVLCGGTTSTGAFQSVSGVGTSGQVLTSNGAGALPTWQNPSGGGGGISDGTTLSTGLTFPNTGLHLLDTNASHDLILSPGSDLTADRTLTITTGDSSRTLTIGADSSISGTAYVSGGSDVPLADGGTGASLSDPNADRIMFWDDSAGEVTWLTAGSGLSITGTTLTATGGGGGADTALSNLASVAINTSLISDTDNTDNLGSAAITWANAFVRIITGSDDFGGDITIRATTNATQGSIFLADQGGHVAIGGGTSASELRLLEPSGGGGSYTGFKAPALAADVIYTLPTADGTNGQALTTNGSKVLSWSTISGGADAALSNLSSVAINAALVLGTSDAAALGSATKMWSDLFLASGGIINWDNGNVAITHSTGALAVSGSVQWVGRTYHDLDTLTDGATITIDWSLGNTFTVTLAGNRTIAFSNTVDGQVIKIRFKQDGTGSRTLTWPGGISWAGGSAPTLTTTANKSDWIGFIRTASGAFDAFVLSQNH